MKTNTQNFTTRFRTKRIAVLMLAVLMLVMTAFPVMAAPRIQKTKYDKYGIVEVDFGSKVQYKNAKVTVKDNTGKSYTTRITERDDDELEFKINNYKEGKTYTYKISGIRKRGEKNYSTISGKVTIPAKVTKTTAPKVKKVEYDREDREVSFDLNTKVTWKNAKVTISDGKKNYALRITDRDNDEIEVRVNKLTRGKTYTYTISGVAKSGTNNYTTIKGTFKA